MPQELHVITGAGSGIGAALARRAALDLGHRVAVVDLSAERAEAVAAEIAAAGGAASAHAADVTDYAHVSGLAAALTAEHGSPALVACNAGIEYTGPLWEMSAESWRRVLGVNLDGGFTMSRAFLPGMIERGAPARMLYTASVGGVTITGNQTAYVVSKHAIRVLAQSVAQDLESIESPVEVSVLLPGHTATRIFEEAETSGSRTANEHREFMLAQLRERGKTPEEVARIAYDGVAAGRRWIYTDPDRARELFDAHAAELRAGIG